MFLWEREERRRKEEEEEEGRRKKKKEEEERKYVNLEGSSGNVEALHEFLRESL